MIPYTSHQSELKINKKYITPTPFINKALPTAARLTRHPPTHLLDAFYDKINIISKIINKKEVDLGYLQAFGNRRGW